MTSDQRISYHLTRDQVLAVCDAINQGIQTRTKMLAEPHMQKPHCADSRLILTNKSKADTALVAAFLDGLKLGGEGEMWPFDRHHAFASQSEIDAAQVTWRG